MKMFKVTNPLHYRDWSEGDYEYNQAVYVIAKSFKEAVQKAKKKIEEERAEYLRNTDQTPEEQENDGYLKVILCTNNLAAYLVPDGCSEVHRV